MLIKGGGLGASDSASKAADDDDNKCPSASLSLKDNVTNVIYVEASREYPACKFSVKTDNTSSMCNDEPKDLDLKCIVTARDVVITNDMNFTNVSEKTCGDVQAEIADDLYHTLSDDKKS